MFLLLKLFFDYKKAPQIHRKRMHCDEKQTRTYQRYTRYNYLHLNIKCTRHD